MARPSHLPRLDYSNYTWRRVQIAKLLIMQFSTARWKSSPNTICILNLEWTGLGSNRRLRIRTPASGCQEAVYNRMQEYIGLTSWGSMQVVLAWLRGLSPRANYAHLATAACRRSYCQRFVDRGCHVMTGFSLTVRENSFYTERQLLRRTCCYKQRVSVYKSDLLASQILEQIIHLGGIMQPVLYQVREAARSTTADVTQSFTLLRGRWHCSLLILRPNETAHGI
jgi:hypothetical protein